MAINENPAKRLLNLVSEVDTCRNRLRSINGQSYTGWLVFAAAFEICELRVQPEREQQNQIVSCIQQIHILVGELEAALIAEEGIDHSKYLRPFPELREFFPDVIGLNNSFDRQVSVRAKTDLEYCSDIIAKLYHEKIISEEALQEILIEIKDLYTKIADSDLDKEVKQVLLDMLMVMMGAIHEYQFRGSDRLRESVEQLVGIYVFHSKVFETGTSEEVSSFKSILSKFVGMYSFSADSVQLLEAASKYMPLLLVAAEKVSSN